MWFVRPIRFSFQDIIWTRDILVACFAGRFQFVRFLFSSSSFSRYILNKIETDVKSIWSKCDTHPEIDKMSVALSLVSPFHLLQALKRKCWLQIRMVRTFYSHQFPDGCVSIFPSVAVAATAVVALDSVRTPSLFHSLFHRVLMFIVFVFCSKIHDNDRWIEHFFVCFERKWITLTCILYEHPLQWLLFLAYFFPFFCHKQCFKLTQSVISFHEHNLSKDKKKVGMPAQCTIKWVCTMQQQQIWH